MLSVATGRVKDRTATALRSLCDRGEETSLLLRERTCIPAHLKSSRVVPLLDWSHTIEVTRNYMHVH